MKEICMKHKVLLEQLQVYEKKRMIQRTWYLSLIEAPFCEQTSDIDKSTNDNALPTEPFFLL